MASRPQDAFVEKARGVVVTGSLIGHLQNVAEEKLTKAILGSFVGEQGVLEASSHSHRRDDGGAIGGMGAEAVAPLRDRREIEVFTGHCQDRFARFYLKVSQLPDQALCFIL